MKVNELDPLSCSIQAIEPVRQHSLEQECEAKDLDPGLFAKLDS